MAFSKIVEGENDGLSFSGNTYAVVIGISDYQNVRDLNFAHKDAEAFANFLKSEAGGGIPEQNIKLFTNQEATSFNIGDAFIWINQLAQPGDRVFIFFAGHGDVEALNDVENGLLLLYKAPTSSYFSFGNDYLPVYEVKKFMKTLNNKNVDAVLISDACRSGKLAGGIEGNQQTSQALVKTWSKEIKILSSLPDQLSQEGEQWGGGRGVFSYYLILGLKGLADLNFDKRITLCEINDYLISRVQQDTEPSRQTPTTSGDSNYILSYVDETTLKETLKEFNTEIKQYSSVNLKGFEAAWFSNRDSLLYNAYSKFEKALIKGILLYPEDNCAYSYYKKVASIDTIGEITRVMQRNLSAALLDKAMTIILPILEGENKRYSMNEINQAIKGLDIAIEMLGREHYITNTIKARRYFLEATAATVEIENAKDSLLYYETINAIIASLEKSIDLEPNAAYAYYGMGYICQKGNKFDRALLAYQKYLDYVPQNKLAVMSIASIYFQLKDYKQSFYYANKALDIDSTYSEAYYLIGKNYFESGNFEKALSSFKLAAKYSITNTLEKEAEVDTDETEVFIDQANTYKNRKEYKKAIKSYQKAASLKLKHRFFKFINGLNK